MPNKPWLVKIGSNRGVARLWLEGKRLYAAGFRAKETKYRVTIEVGRITILALPDGDRRVSGKGDKPIIDINTAELNKVGGVGTKLEVATAQGVLVLIPASAELTRVA